MRTSQTTWLLWMAEEFYVLYLMEAVLCPGMIGGPLIPAPVLLHSFFEVTPGRHPSCNVGKYASARSIKAKLLQTAQLVTRTDELRTCGQIEACFSEGM